MHKSVVAAAALAVLVPTAAFGADLITVLFGKADEAYAAQGYKPTGWAQQGVLAKGAEERLTVKLAGGGDFQLVGVCDDDCEDMDIQLLDTNGKQVDKDEKEDDFPIVAATSPGTYTARVTMVKCGAASCAFGVKAFVK